MLLKLNHKGGYGNSFTCFHMKAQVLQKVLDTRFGGLNVKVSINPFGSDDPNKHWNYGVALVEDKTNGNIRQGSSTTCQIEFTDEVGNFHSYEIGDEKGRGLIPLLREHN